MTADPERRTPDGRRRVGGRTETEAERLDRNAAEITQELRVGAVGMIGIFVLITDYLFGDVASAVTGLLTALIVGGLWFGLPVLHRTQT